MDRLPLPRPAPAGRARAHDARGRHPRRHVQPDDLPEGDLVGETPTTSSSASSRSRRERPRELFIQLATRTSATRCDLLRAGVERTARGATATSRSRSIPRSRTTPRRRSTRRSGFDELIDRPNLYVKIPGTKEGLPAIEEMISRGRLDQRHADLLARPLRGGRRGLHPRPRAARRGRRRPGQRHLGRELLRLAASTRRSDRRLDEIGGHGRAQGQARDRQREARLRALQGDLRGRALGALAAKGARPQLCLWASTSTKNPAYRDVIYVEELIGPDTVNTMPEETIRAFQDHGEVEPHARAGPRRGAAACSTQLAARGRRLRRRRRHARARGRGEVLRLLRRAARGHPEASRRELVTA